jgi:hypothetical protein
VLSCMVSASRRSLVCLLSPWTVPIVVRMVIFCILEEAER